MTMNPVKEKQDLMQGKWISPKEDFPPENMEVILCLQHISGIQNLMIGRFSKEFETLNWYTKVLPPQLSENGWEKEGIFEKLNPGWFVAYWMFFPFRPYIDNVSEKSKELTTYKDQ